MGSLWAAHRPGVFNFLRKRYIGPVETVEDLTEDILRKVFNRLDQYEARGVPFSAWIYRVARNHLGDYLRGQVHRRAMSLDSLSVAVADSTPSIAQERVLDRVMLDSALGRLPVDQQRAVQFRFLDDLSVAETARLMGCTEGTVKRLQRRGLERLRALLEAGRGAPSDTAESARLTHSSRTSWSEEQGPGTTVAA